MNRLATVALAALLAVPAAASAQGRPAPEDPGAALDARLRALDADAGLGPLAAYERLRARQALEALAAARGAQAAADARQVAEWRVETGEVAAATALARRRTDRLARERRGLPVEASRQGAAPARAEAGPPPRAPHI